jgi:hypothetical protein
LKTLSLCFETPEIETILNVGDSMMPIDTFQVIGLELRALKPEVESGAA